MEMASPISISARKSHFIALMVATPPSRQYGRRDATVLSSAGGPASPALRKSRAAMAASSTALTNTTAEIHNVDSPVRFAVRPDVHLLSMESLQSPRLLNAHLGLDGH